MNKTSDKEWNKFAEKNAKHIAMLHLELGNAPKIAAAFRDVPILTALEFLFEEAEKNRKEKKFKKAKVLLEAATLIDRKTGQAIDISLEIDSRGKEEKTKIYVHRHNPKDILES